MNAYEGKTVKQWLMDLARVRLAEIEKRGNFAQGEGVNPRSITICLENTYADRVRN